MEQSKIPLLKHFSLVFKNLAKGEQQTPEMNSNLLKFFSRKELIEIIKRMHNGTIPKELNLMEMENEELLKTIGNVMYIISYVTEKWSLEASNETDKPVSQEKKSSTPPSKKNGAK